MTAPGIAPVRHEVAATLPSDTPPARCVVLAIARFELFRLVRHPLVLVAAAASLVLLWLDVVDAAPVLDRDSVLLAGRLLPFAAVIVVVAHGLATRSGHAQTTEFLDSLPTRTGARIVGEGLAGIGPVALALLVLATGMAYLAVGEPIGTWQWLELAVAPLVVALAHVFGLALGQWLAARVTSVVTVIGLLYLQAWADPAVDAAVTPILSALAPYHALLGGQPYIWQPRAPGAKLVWLFALGGMLLVGAVLRRQRSRQLLVAGVTAVAVAVVSAAFSLDAVGAEAQAAMYAQDQRFAQLAAEHDDEVCVNVDEAVTVCAAPGFDGWVPRWTDTVRQVTDVLGGGVEVMQQTWANPSSFGGRGGAAVVDLTWDRPGGQGTRGFDLAVQVAIGRMLAFDGSPEATVDGADEVSDVCWLGGEARAGVALWAAVQGDDRWVDELQVRVEHARRYPMMIEGGPDTSSTASPLTSVDLGQYAWWYGAGAPDAELALAMLQVAPERLGAVVLDDLAYWADPSVSGVELASALGLPPPAQEPGQPSSWYGRCA